ncbi:hypothetical protein K438DRAFT_1952895 [Mycena galopus ATCC 62051]|nr:hypothetical protein K438DRAFT_1952895 [Mycena galopus ATCC 62051]
MPAARCLQEHAHRKTPAAGRPWAGHLLQDTYRKTPAAGHLGRDTHHKTPAARCMQQDLRDQTSAVRHLEPDTCLKTCWDYLDSPDLGSYLLLIPSNGKLNFTIARIGGAKYPGKRKRSESASSQDHFTELAQWAKTNTEGTTSPAATKPQAMEEYAPFKKIIRNALVT